MAKLGVQTTAGFNAGKSYYAKPIRVTEIIIDPEISEIFSIQDQMIADIRDKMEKFGYDNSQPVVVWKGKNIIVDGHTRLAAAKKAGLEEIPTVEMEFADLQEAKLYTFERQALRRNLGGSEILKAAQMILAKGGGAPEIVKRLGISRAAAYQAVKIVEEGSQEDMEAIIKGETSIKKVYSSITENNPQRAQKQETAIGIPKVKQTKLSVSAEVKFLEESVNILVVGGEKNAATILVKHFLSTTEEVIQFNEMLPENIREVLNILPVDSTGRQ